ncbi:tetratricopeptide repeat protein [Actinoplanes sp. NBRC 103695]|uniref:tetratricopeptide repeat protein n=1 Tax=Actinoplanes sp. NBRC 103695 TaxID=3032202 RepID=UPI0024A5AF8D|nr:tetratricopeptide repeat protein [Actinoplanes sp. NBRC 103695]GLZ00265.1 hypothetical protein Acsp02_75170 [Actinoplanes sp. NBRC 103695]
MIAEVVDERGASWTGGTLVELVDLIPNPARRRLLALTAVALLSAHLREGNTDEGQHIRTVLAEMLQDQGRFEMAEVELRVVLAARTALRGAEHPDSLYTPAQAGGCAA